MSVSLLQAFDAQVLGALRVVWFANRHEYTLFRASSGRQLAAAGAIAVWIAPPWMHPLAAMPCLLRMGVPCCWTSRAWLLDMAMSCAAELRLPCDTLPPGLASCCGAGLPPRCLLLAGRQILRGASSPLHCMALGSSPCGALYCARGDRTCAVHRLGFWDCVARA